MKTSISRGYLESNFGASLDDHSGIEGAMVDCVCIALTVAVTVVVRLYPRNSSSLISVRGDSGPINKSTISGESVAFVVSDNLE